MPKAEIDHQLHLVDLEQTLEQIPVHALHMVHALRKPEHALPKREIVLLQVRHLNPAKNVLYLHSRKRSLLPRKYRTK